MHQAESKQETQALRIWAITDDKPGHRNQTQGLVEALSHRRRVDVVWIPAQSNLVNLKLLLCHGDVKPREINQVTPPALIIAAGHRTHLTLLALRRWVKCRFPEKSTRRTVTRAIVLMRPSLPLSWFDLCLIPRHDHPPQATNVIETIGPLNRVTASVASNRGRGLVLLGGPSGHYDWDSGSIVEQIVRLPGLGRKKEALDPQSVSTSGGARQEWTLAGSRRTPDEIYEMLSTRLGDEVCLVRPRDVSADWLVEQYASAAQIWVTEDSMSMVFEALSSGAPTGLLRMPAKGATRVSREIIRLIEEGRLMTLDQPVMAQKVVAQKKQHLTLHEAKRCATLIIERFTL